MQTVTFGTKNSYDDFGLILTDKEIGFPEPKLEQVNLAGMDGVIDLSESLADDIKYETRTLTFTFAVIDPMERWSVVLSDLANYIHGKRLKIQMDFDLSFYYMGRCKLNPFKTNKRLGEIVVECQCDPYKIDATVEGGNWIWDTFSFINGFIRVNEVTVDGTLTVNLLSLRKVVSPTFICSDAMTVSFKGVTYELEEGTNIVYGIRLQNGTNYVTFTGDGTVKIEYQGGEL